MCFQVDVKCLKCNKEFETSEDTTYTFESWTDDPHGCDYYENHKCPGCETEFVVDWTDTYLEIS